MSSPSLPYDGATPRSEHNVSGGNDLEASGLEIPKRLMKVKVLYTFDDQNKTNCLARLPNAVNVPVVELDDSTQVGVIELRTCIQAIITASPELLTKLEHDYTVYAYDFSEYDTPLVGQGLLSAVLASANSAVNALPSDGQAMITGRVCRNILGIFSGGASETLEVKLRLVPVPSCSQPDYMSNMQRYRNMNRSMTDMYDQHVAWSNAPRDYPDDPRLAGPSPQTQPPIHRGGLQRSYSMASDSLHDMLAPRGRAPDYDGGMTPTYSMEGSRVGSPAPSVHSTNGQSQIQQPYPPTARPASRMSAHGEPIGQPMQEWNMDQYGEAEGEDGPSRKRARLEQVEWRGKASFGAKQDSLRVAASTQASLRGHRPLPGHLMNHNNDGPGRAPTPRPQRIAQPDRRLAQPGTSTLRQESAYDSDTLSSCPTIPVPQLDSGVYSAEDDQTGSQYLSPTSDIPSSPPELPIAPPAPPSPVPVARPAPNDSGFGSDAVDAQEQRARNKEMGKKKQLEAIHKRNSTSDWISHCYGPQELLPSKINLTENFERAQKNLTSYRARLQHAAPEPTPPATQGTRKKQASKANRVEQPEERPLNPLPSENPIPSTPCPAGREPERPIAPAPSRSQQPNPPALLPMPLPPLLLPPSEVAEAARRNSVTAKPPAKKSKANSKPRSRTASKAPTPTELPMEPVSTPAPEGAPEPLPAKPRSGSGARRKKTIQDSLDHAIRSGEMPRFCINCGDIKPSTWRKAFMTVVEGDPAGVVLSSEPGGVVCTQAVESDANERVTKYRVFKKSPSPEDKVGETIEEVTLCNSCGIYFVSKGAMRPPFLWVKRNKPTEPRVRTKKKKTDYSGVPQPSSDVFVPQSDGVMSVDLTGDNGPTHDAADTAVTPSDPAESQPPPPAGNSTSAALQRVVNATPANTRPETQLNPAESDNNPTPKPTRRLLFPSPRKEGEVKLLGEDPAGSKTSPTQATAGEGNSPTGPAQSKQQNGGSESTTNEAGSEPPDEQNGESTEGDKENQPPPISDYELAHLFDDLPDIDSPSGPKTPRKTPQSNKSNSTFSFASLLKTPTPGTRRSIRLAEKSGGKDRSSRSRRDGEDDAPFADTPSRSSKRKRGNHGAQDADAAGNDDGRPSHALGMQMTPFTAQLNQMLSDGLFTSPQRTFGLISSPGRIWGTAHLDGGGIGLQLDGEDWTSEGFFDADLTELPMDGGDVVGLGVVGELLGPAGVKDTERTASGVGTMTDATVPSSPPPSGALHESALGFEFYVDPDADDEWSVPKEIRGLGLQDRGKGSAMPAASGTQAGAVDAMDTLKG